MAAESAHYVHYKPDGTIIGSEYTNRPATIPGTTRMQVSREVGNQAYRYRVDVGSSMEPVLKETEGG